MSELFHSAQSVGWITENMCYHREHGPCRIYNIGEVRFSQIDPTSWCGRRQGPAAICANGHVSFCNDQNELHRTDGPAVIRADGVKEYWVDGYELSVDEFFIKYGVL